jgi:TBC1 domain family member 13
LRVILLSAKQHLDH